jgi:hypothetical protein
MKPVKFIEIASSPLSAQWLQRIHLSLRAKRGNPVLNTFAITSNINFYQTEFSSTLYMKWLRYGI